MLEDPVLHVTKPVVILVEDDAGLLHVEAVLRLVAPWELEDGLEPCPDPAVLGALLARPLELVHLLQHGSLHGLRKGRLFRPGPEVPRLGSIARSGELTELLADRLQLAAEEELALGLLHPLLDARLDLVAKSKVSEGVSRPREHEAKPLGDVDRLEDLHLVLERQVRRVAGEIGDEGRLCHLPQPFSHPAGTPREQDVLEHGAVLAGELDRRRRRWRVREGVNLDPQCLARCRARPCLSMPSQPRGRRRRAALRAAHPLRGSPR